jgi:biopolymer transport protein ExbD
LAGGTNADDDDGINEINVVPLVDIMLVLLIIFMVTTEFVQERFDEYEPPPNVPVLLPSAASAEETNDMLLSLAINSEGALFLNGDATTLDGVKERVERLKSQGAKLEAFVAADKRLTFEKVVEVVDTLRLLGVSDVAINTKPIEIQ